VTGRRGDRETGRKREWEKMRLCDFVTGRMGDGETGRRGERARRGCIP